MTAVWIAEQAAFEELITKVSLEERYALDTEFHRERTYFPRLALIQIAWSGGVALIDPIAVDMSAFVPLMESDALAVLHAAQQDLDVLQTACRAVPKRLFDTQLAAGFLGNSTPSLSSLLASELKVHVAKGDRLTDWLQRPLTQEQRDYAASDVDHLLELHDRITAQLVELGRLEWALQACEELRCRPVGPTDPTDAWLKIKDAKILKAKSRGVARAVAAWRERRAANSDIPVRQVLPDLAILGVAQRAPRTIPELMSCRGVEERHTRGKLGEEILAAVAFGREDEPDMPTGDGEELSRSLRPAVTLVSAWIGELSRQRKIDPTLLATRSDLVALLRGDEEARLTQGWRAEFIGDDLRRLVAGHAALSFDGKGGLRLIDLGDAP
ncbi:MAG: HRDC domain-containing protein [Actinomycetota bacterium]